MVGSKPSGFEAIHTPEQARAFLTQHESFLFDCDGVLWRGDQLLPGAAETLQMLRRHGKRTVFVTNNATKSRAAFRAKFEKFGLGEVDIEHLVPSSYVAARWLARSRPKLTHAFVIGAEGLCAELRDVGLQVLTASDFVVPGSEPSCNDASSALAALARAVDEWASVGAVVVGHDPAFDFRSLCLASLFLEREGVAFVATNADAYDVVADRRMPGNGCLVAAVATAAGRPPDAVCGKPAAELASYLVSAFSLDPARTCVVGDRLDTDIALAHAMGASSLLVLTGVATAGDLLRAAGSGETAGADAVAAPTHATSHVAQLLLLCEAS